MKLKSSLAILITSLMLTSCGTSNTDGTTLPADSKASVAAPAGFWKQFEGHSFSSILSDQNGTSQNVQIQFSEDTSVLDPYFSQATGRLVITPVGQNVLAMSSVTTHLIPSNTFSDSHFDYYIFDSFIFENTAISFFDISIQFIATFNKQENGGQFIPSYSGLVVRVCDGTSCSYQADATDTANFTTSLK